MAEIRRLNRGRAVWLALGLVAAGLQAAAGADFRIGAGVQFWRTSDAPVDPGIDRNGRSEFITFQRSFFPWIKGQIDLERFPVGFAGSPKSVFAPQALLVAGGWVYAAAGAGILYADGRLAERPFYQARAGIDWPLLPRIRLDVHARYHVSEWGRINRADRTFESDLWSIGAALKIAL